MQSCTLKYNEVINIDHFERSGSLEQYLKDVFDRLSKSVLSITSRAGNLKGSPTTEPRALIIEDQPINSYAARWFLEAQGYIVDVVEEGLKGVEQFKSTEGYQLVVLDIKLPDISGIEVAKKIRSWEKKFNVQQDGQATIVALSTEMTSTAWSDCLEAGMQAAFPKPLTSELTDRIIGLCKKKS